MTIKLEINLTNKWLYSLIIISVLFIVSAGVWAYNSGKSPNVMGHSGEEIEVTIDGQTKSLNDVFNGGTNVDVYKCPIGTNGWHPGGDWGYYGCQGQLTTNPICTNIESPNYQTRNCTYLGKMRIYPD